MLESVLLYNLYVGEKRPQAPWDQAVFGDFLVRLLPDYEDRIKKLYRPEIRKVTWLPEEGFRQVVSHHEGRPGDWEMTAEIVFKNHSRNETSLLLRDPSPDGGVWDVCTILSFLTGRTVLDKHPGKRVNPERSVNRACTDIETLHAAALAFTNRRNLVETGMEYSIIMLLEAMRYDSFQSIALLNNTAFNIILDKWPITINDIDKDQKNELREAITSGVESTALLTLNQKKAANAILRGRINQGLLSLSEKTETLLKVIGAIPKDCDENTIKRVMFLNKLRNHVVHTGRVPEIKGLDREISDHYAFIAAAQVIPGIVSAAIGYKLGFSQRGLGSLCLNLHEYTKFFTDGFWGDWDIENVNYDDWWNGIES